MSEQPKQVRRGGAKAFLGWFVVTFLIGAFSLGGGGLKPSSVVGAGLVAAVLAWFMAFKVMPTSATPAKRADRVEPRINQYKLVMLIGMLLLVAAITIALLQST